MRIVMKINTKRIAAAVMSVILAAGCTGCSVVTDLLAEHNIDIPFLKEKSGSNEEAEVGNTASEGSTSVNTELASKEEPERELTAAEQRKLTEGKVLNIYCWDESLESLFIMYYPGYKDVDDRQGMIGNVTVNWVIPENEGDYMDLVAEKLLTTEYLVADDRVDLFLAPEEDLAIYVNSDYSLDVKEKLGMTDEELEDQFSFTQQMASTDEGVLKAVTWQATPGVFVYRRSIAKDVFGTDDPDAVQKEIEDWDKFSAAAAAMKKKKHFMVSGYFDTFIAYRYSADRHWENNGELVIPEAMSDWHKMMKRFTNKKYHNSTQYGEAGWVADQGPKGNVFGFFRAITDIDSKMAAYSLEDANEAPAVGNGIYGDYAVCCGPQPFCRGGVWILAASSTDNLTLDKEIMENLTCNSDLLYKIARNENIFTNTISGMKKMAAEADADPFLGGQNPYEVYYDVATRLNTLSAGNYDRWMADAYRNSKVRYYTGEMKADEATEYFYKRVRTRYPELTVNE